MSDSHRPLTHPPPFRFGSKETRATRRVLLRTHQTQHWATLIAKDLQRLVHQLLQPRTLDEEILVVLPGTTDQIVTMVRRRKQTVLAAIRALAAAGQIERRDRRWVRVRMEDNS
jgi:hypothetical protein